MLPAPEQRLVSRWRKLLRQRGEGGERSKSLSRSPGCDVRVVLRQVRPHELGGDAANREALMDYQPKLRMREQSADSARKAKMKKLASDYFIRYRCTGSKRGSNTAPSTRGISQRGTCRRAQEVDLFRGRQKGYLYVDRQRLIKAALRPPR